MRGLLVSLVGNLVDVDDLVQQVSLIAWRKYGEFSQGTDFTSWVCQIAYLEAKHFFKTRSRFVQPSEALLELLYRESMEQGAFLDAQIDLLDGCLRTLPARDYELIYLRYHDERRVDDIAQAMRCSESAVYKALERIHSRLAACVNRKMQDEEGHS